MNGVDVVAGWLTEWVITNKLYFVLYCVQVMTNVVKNIWLIQEEKEDDSCDDDGDGQFLVIS